jgi:predicted negative regulator of RcsB-dependent stress response
MTESDWLIVGLLVAAVLQLIGWRYWRGMNDRMAVRRLKRRFAHLRARSDGF